MSRTNNKWIRPYLNGYRAGEYAVNVGNLGFKHEVSTEAAYTDEIKNAMPGRADVTADALNTILAPSAATGLYELCNSGLGTFDYMVAYGVQAVPKAGDPIFAWRFEQAGYQADPGSGFVMANIDLFSTFATSNPAVLGGYSSPFGVLIHADGAETAVNSAVGIDDNGAASTKGGVFFYHLFTSNGTVTLKIQEASTNTDGSFGDLTGATSGSIDASVTPKSGQAACSASAAVKRYLRWQLVFGTADTATFVLGFHRGR